MRRVSPLCAVSAPTAGVCAATVKKPTLHRCAGNVRKHRRNTPVQRREAPPQRGRILPFGRSQHRIWLVAGVPASCQMLSNRAEARAHFYERRKDEKRQTIQHSDFRTGFRNDPPKKQRRRFSMSQSDYVTACCLGKRIVILDGLREVLRQQKAIGNNLNQLTVLANMGQGPVRQFGFCRARVFKNQYRSAENAGGGRSQIAIVHFVNYKKGDADARLHEKRHALRFQTQ